jgi:hypothetical protein
VTTSDVDVTCEHGTLLAAWCGQCALEWVPDREEPATADSGRAQSAA